MPLIFELESRTPLIQVYIYPKYSLKRSSPRRRFVTHLVSTDHVDCVDDRRRHFTIVDPKADYDRVVDEPVRWSEVRGVSIGKHRVWRGKECKRQGKYNVVVA